jgi:hypothetical protein
VRSRGQKIYHYSLRRLRFKPAIMLDKPCQASSNRSEVSAYLGYGAVSFPKTINVLHLRLAVLARLVFAGQPRVHQAQSDGLPLLLKPHLPQSAL